MSLVGAAKARWTAFRDRHGWLQNVLSAWGLLQRNNGNLYAGAITYFSFLALFPLLLLAVSITGFVLHSHPGTQEDLFRHLSEKVPGEFGKTLNSSLHTAIDNRSGVGVIGLAGVLLTGLGWIGNLRAAIDAVWGRPITKVNFLKAKVANLFVLAGLGIGIAVSLGLTVVGTALTDQILRSLGLDDLPGAHALLKVLGIAIAVAGDMIIFWWLLVRLPQVAVPLRIAVQGALLAAVGFEVLKVAGTYTIAQTAHSPTAGPFAGIIAVLVWIQLVARFMLFACAWTATRAAAEQEAMANRIPVTEPEAMEAAAPDRAVPAASPARVAAALVGAGAAIGSAATWLATRPEGRARRRGSVARARLRRG